MAVLLLWVHFAIYVSRLSSLYCLLCSLQHCGHLLGKCYLYALLCVMFPCVFVAFLYDVRVGWYLIDSIPDLFCINGATGRMVKPKFAKPFSFLSLNVHYD